MKKAELEERVEALEAQVKALVEMFAETVQEAEADQFAEAGAKFRERVREHRNGVLR